jgi:hypothetical protein
MWTASRAPAEANAIHHVARHRRGAQRISPRHTAVDIPQVTERTICIQAATARAMWTRIRMWLEQADGEWQKLLFSKRRVVTNRRVLPVRSVKRQSSNVIVMCRAPSRVLVTPACRLSRRGTEPAVTATSTGAITLCRVGSSRVARAAEWSRVPRRGGGGQGAAEGNMSRAP